MTDLWNDLWKWLYGKALVSLTQPEGGVGIVETLGSGYSVEGDRMEKVATLQALCEEAVSNPRFEARDGKKFCNLGARFIAEGMGFFGFPVNILANEMVGFLASHPDWTEDSIDRAHRHAERGGLAFLTVEEHPHGHIAAIYPAPMEMSGTWGEPVPMLAQIGSAAVGNGIKKASAVYRLEKRPLLRAFLFGEAP